MNRKIRDIFVLIAGIVGFICSLILFIQSKSVYSDEYGTDVSFNEDYVILILCTISIILYSIICYIADKKKESHNQADLSLKLVISALVSFYSLGLFLKSLFKALNKHATFDFNNYELYLFVGLFTLVLFICYTYQAISIQKNFHKNK